MEDKKEFLDEFQLKYLNEYLLHPQDEISLNTLSKIVPNSIRTNQSYFYIETYVHADGFQIDYLSYNHTSPLFSVREHFLIDALFEAIKKLLTYDKHCLNG